jgi:hypothetical protein
MAGAWTQGRGSWLGSRRAHLGRGGACGGDDDPVARLESPSIGVAPLKEEGGGGVSVLRALPVANGGPRTGNLSTAMQGARDGDHCPEECGVALCSWASMGLRWEHDEEEIEGGGGGRR